MAISKSSTVVESALTMTAGAGDVTGAVQDLTAVYQATLRVRFTNGGTGPTVRPQCKVQLSEDTTSGNFMTLDTLVGDTVNSSVIEHAVLIPDTTLQLRLVTGSNTVQAVTLRAVLDKIIGI